MTQDSTRNVAVAGGANASSAHGEVVDYLESNRLRPCIVLGEAVEVLSAVPDGVFDCAMTSPPYWGHRTYDGGGVGQEDSPEGYIDALLAVTAEVRRTLKGTGSLWLNLGDTYRNKHLQGLPWRVALALADRQGWVLRNSVIWHKVKGGPDNSKDKLRNVHEFVFHFVKQPRGYYYDVDAIRTPPKKAKVRNGAVVSATGVSGVRYRRQIELSTSLTDGEKTAASSALDEMLGEVQAGRLADFRMVIRKQQRTTHSDSTTVSGRAKELEQRGFYFLRYHPEGTKPSDVWDLLPEDSQGREGHFAAYPQELCRIPLLATCPPDGVVLDPFCGTGTTCLVAQNLGRRSVGIDIANDYVMAARDRCWSLL